MNFKIIIPAVIALLVLVAAGTGYFYYQSLQKSESQQQSAQEEVNKLVEEVGRLIDLPVGEDPTIATVTEIEKLKDQPFFQKAKNGDKVLLYQGAKKAILYRPSLKKVIEVAPINIGTPSASFDKTQDKSLGTSSSAQVVLRNGTSRVGLTNTVEGELKKVIPNLNVISKENAVKKDYQNTVVVLLNETFRSSADELAKALETNIGSLPAGEEKPDDVDILVILGKDRL